MVPLNSRSLTGSGSGGRWPPAMKRLIVCGQRPRQWGMSLHRVTLSAVRHRLKHNLLVGALLTTSAMFLVMHAMSFSRSYTIYEVFPVDSAGSLFLHARSLELQGGEIEFRAKATSQSV